MKFKRSKSSQAFELKNLKFGNFMFGYCKIFLQETISTTIIHTKMAQEKTCLFEAKLYLVSIMSTRVPHGLKQRKAIK